MRKKSIALGVCPLCGEKCAVAVSFDEQGRWLRDTIRSRLKLNFTDLADHLFIEHGARAVCPCGSYRRDPAANVMIAIAQFGEHLKQLGPEYVEHLRFWYLGER